MRLSVEDFQELERRVADRDAAAFDTLHRAYQALVHKFVASKTSNHPLSLEITRQIFATAWEKIDRYPWRDFSFHVWILRLARRELESRGLVNHEDTWLDRVL